MVEYFRCRRCLYPNTKPDLWFSAEGICSACQAYDARTRIDWSAKRQEFLQFVSDHRGRTHDCIVACSGGKDSTYIVALCLLLGLRPLAVTATTDHLSAIGRRNLDNISRWCDHIEVTPHKPTRNKIAKFALQEVGDISWCEHHLIWSIPAREAVARGIPVVLYGECPQNEYGAGPAGSERQSALTHDWVHEFGGLLGLRLEDVGDILGIPARELDLYRYPDGGEVHAVFTGSYFPWDGWRNAEIARVHGFRAWMGDVEGSLFGYENLDNHQTGIHDRLRFLKFGYSRACDIASNHLRRGGVVKRHQWAEMVRAVEVQPFTTYLGMTATDILANIGVTLEEWDAICERFTNKPVLEWALSEGSYRSYCGTAAAA